MESIICNCCFEVYESPHYLSCGCTMCRPCLNNNSNINISTLVSNIGTINNSNSYDNNGTNNNNNNNNNQIICKICDKKVNNYYLNKEIQLLLDQLKIKSCSKHSRKETNQYCLDCKSLCCSNCKTDKLHKNHQFTDYNIILFNAIYYNIEKLIINKNKSLIVSSTSSSNLNTIIKNNISIKLKDQRVRFNHTFFNNCKEVQYTNFIKNKIKELVPKNGNYSKRDFYLKSIDINKNSAISYFNLALTLIDSSEKQVKLFDGTIMNENELYLKSIQLNPNNPFCYFNLAIGLNSITTSSGSGNGGSPSNSSLSLNSNNSTTTTSSNGSVSTNSNSNTISQQQEVEQNLITLPNGKKVNNIGLFIRAIEVDPNYSYAYYNLGKSLKTSTVIFSNSTVMKRKDLFIKYIHFHPNHSFAYNNLAINIKANELITLLNGKKMSQSDLYKKAIDLNPLYSNPYINLASITTTEPTVTLLNGTIFTKKQLYLKAIDTDPLNSNAYNNLATNMEKDEVITLLSGEKLSKKQLLLKSLDCNPLNSNAYNNLALYLKTNEEKLQLLNGVWYDKKQLYIKSISIEPINNLMAYNNLSNCLKQNEKVTLLNDKIMDKKQLYIKCISIDSTIPRIFINLAKNLNFIEKVQLEDGSKLSKKDILVKILDLEPNVWIHYYNLANSMKLNETIKLSANGASPQQEMNKKELYLRAIDLNADSDARLYNTLVGILKNNETIKFLNGTTFNKKDLYLKSIQLEPDNSNTYFSLSLLLLHNESVTMLPWLSSQHSPSQKLVFDNENNSNGGPIKMNKKQLLIKTIQLDPLNSKAYINLADEIDSNEVVSIYNYDGTVIEPMSKIDLYVKSISVFAKNAIAYYNIALHLPAYNQSITLLNGKVMTKKQLLCKAISINNRFSDAYHLLASFLDHNETIQLNGSINGIIGASNGDAILKSNNNSNELNGGSGNNSPSTSSITSSGTQKNKSSMKLSSNKSSSSTSTSSTTNLNYSKKDLLIIAIKINPDPNYFFSLATYFKNESVLVNTNLSEMLIKYGDIRMRPRDVYIQSCSRIPPFLLLQTVDDPFHYLNDVIEIESTDISKRQAFIDKYLNLIDLNPTCPNYYHSLGYYLSYKESIKLLKQDYKQHHHPPTQQPSSTTNNSISTPKLLYSKIDLFIKAIELDPNHIQSYFSLYLFIHLSRGVITTTTIDITSNDNNNSNSSIINNTLSPSLSNCTNINLNSITLSNGEVMFKEDLIKRMEFIDKKFTSLMFTIPNSCNNSISSPYTSSVSSPNVQLH